MKSFFSKELVSKLETSYWLGRQGSLLFLVAFVLNYLFLKSFSYLYLSLFFLMCVFVCIHFVCLTFPVSYIFIIFNQFTCSWPEDDSVVWTVLHVHICKIFSFGFCLARHTYFLSRLIPSSYKTLFNICLSRTWTRSKLQNKKRRTDYSRSSTPLFNKVSGKTAAKSRHNRGQENVSEFRLKVKPPTSTQLREI